MLPPRLCARLGTGTFQDERLVGRPVFQRPALNYQLRASWFRWSARGCRSCVGLLAVILFQLLSGTPLNAQDKDSFVIKTNYYAVTGSSIRELQISQRERRPWKTNFLYFARTDWEVKYRFRYRRMDDGYRVEQFSVNTEAEMTLPRWVPPPGVDAAVVERWKRYYQALLAHELGHVAIARSATVAVRRQVETLGSCDAAAELRDTLRRAVHLLLDKYKRRDRNYDERTRHGVSQGARLH